MNFNFKIKGFEVKVKDQADIRIDEVEIGYEDVKLSEIPGIIKELRKAFVELKDNAPEMTHEIHELHVQSPFTAGFPFFTSEGFPPSEESDMEDNELFDEESKQEKKKGKKGAM